METKKLPSLLIVEDDFENQKLLVLFLKRKFTVDFCDSAETFYEKLNEKEYDIILMDIALRGSKDGLQITKELRASDKYKNMPIVALSAHAFQKDKDNSYRAGVDLFVTKPVQNSVLMDSLLKILELKTGIKQD